MIQLIAPWVATFILLLVFAGCVRYSTDPIPEEITETIAEEFTLPFTAEIIPAPLPGEENLYIGGLNADKMMISSVQHLPIYRFDDAATLSSFLSGKACTLDMAAYDGDFFSDTTLLLVYHSAGSPSLHFHVDSVYCDGGNLAVHVAEEPHPETVTEEETAWLFLVAVAREKLESCMVFDAYLTPYIPEVVAK